MKGKTVWLLLSCLIVTAMLLASCAKSTPTTTSTTSPTTSPITTSTTTPITTSTTTPTTTTGNWWDVYGTPKYGGTITMRTSKDPTYFDPYRYATAGPSIEGDPKNYYGELLAMNDPTIDPKIWDFTTNFNPQPYKIPCLAESWEQPDLQTLIFHIRKGIKWQDKAPVNGREFTAYDVEYSWQRHLGLGSGFTKPTIYAGTTQFSQISAITATDKYTVVFKMKEPALQMLLTLTDHVYGHVVPREVIDKYGDMLDWHNAVGTGPFQVSDYVSGSSVLMPRNPNYWGVDERYPGKNYQLPYADGIKMVIIPDLATAMAGMRTGKIDVLDAIPFTESASLKKTNPEIQQGSRISNGLCPMFKYGVKPFSDIRVRQAMQMAIDLATIAKTYFGGLVDGLPYPTFSPSVKGYSTPYEEWSQELKDSYAYNPAEAKKLLADAGYPTGFKTNLVAPTTDDLALLQIVKAYLLDIGIDMEIKATDPAVFTNITKSGGYDQMITSTTSVTSPFPPHMMMVRWYPGHASNYAFTIDDTYKAMVDKALAATTEDDYKKLVNIATDYVTKQQWAIILPPVLSFYNYQPWIKGGYINQIAKQSYQFARTWVDQDLKKSMGH